MINTWAGPWENVSYVICEQQMRRSACASAQSGQRLCCSLLREYYIFRFYSRNSKTLASFCGCAGRFVPGLVGNFRRHILSYRGSHTSTKKFPRTSTVDITIIVLMFKRSQNDGLNKIFCNPFLYITAVDESTVNRYIMMEEFIRQINLRNMRLICG